MKRHGGLFNKIVKTQNLYLASKKAFCRRKFRYTSAPFYFNLENELLHIQRALIDASYHPLPYKIFKIREPKERVICCAPFQDRVVHHAIINILEPIFEKKLINDTYACRVGKGVHVALKKSKNLVRTYNYYLKCDIKKYFESIDHQVLGQLINKTFKDSKLINLLNKIISHQPPYTEKGKGLPIGNLTSQHFANIYLGELDLFIKHKLKCRGYVRYMDDFILFSNSKKELRSFLEKIKNFLSHILKLKLKEKAIRISPVKEGLPFLGHRVFRGLIRLQRANFVRLRRKVFKMEQKYMKGQIKQEELISSVQSLVACMSYGQTRNLRNKIFSLI